MTTAHANAASPRRAASNEEARAQEALELQDEIALLSYCTGGVPVISLSPAAVCAVRDGLRRVLGTLGDLTLVRTISALPVEEAAVLFERPLEQVWDRIGRSFERLAQVASDPTAESTWAEICRVLSRNALNLSPSAPHMASDCAAPRRSRPRSGSCRPRGNIRRRHGKKGR